MKNNNNFANILTLISIIITLLSLCKNEQTATCNIKNISSNESVIIVCNK